MTWMLSVGCSILDAAFVNRFGSYWRGVEETVSGHAGIHVSIYRDSTLKNDAPDVDQISDNAAILHFWSRLSTCAEHPVGPHQVYTLILAVVKLPDGEWRIQALQNVTLTDPMTGAMRLSS
jgi:uncharacterized protein (TIGR02246 family)